MGHKISLILSIRANYTVCRSPRQLHLGLWTLLLSSLPTTMRRSSERGPGRGSLSPGKIFSPAIITRMRIGIDTRLAHYRRAGGIAQYTLSLLLALLKLGGGDRL